MIRNLNDDEINLLYHALGNKLSDGLTAFEDQFNEAAMGYQLTAINSLLDLLADSTLSQDEEREAWLHYYAARKALLQWQPRSIDEALKKISVATLEKIPVLQARVALISGQANIIRGEWSQGIADLSNATKSLSVEKPDPSIEIDAEEWKARAYIGMAESAGGWLAPRNHGFNNLFQFVLTIINLPIFAVTWLYLALRGVRELSRPIFLYGVYYSNWLIFLYYLEAFRAVRHALDLSRKLPPNTAHQDRTIVLETIQAKLMQSALQHRKAKELYTNLLTLLNGNNKYGGYDYQIAFIKEQLAQVYLDLEDRRESIRCLTDARKIYDRLQDNRAVARSDALRGRLALDSPKPEEAIPLWTEALKRFESDDDTITLAAVLNHLYTALNTPTVSPDIKIRLEALLKDLKRRAFAVRSPQRLFHLIQTASWTISLGLAILLFAIVARTIDRSSGSQQVYVGLQGFLATTGIAVAIIGLVNPLLRLVGLASTLGTQLMLMKYIVVDSDGLWMGSLVGEAQATWKWQGIDAYVQVDRCLIWASPSPALSFEYLHSTDDGSLQIPHTISGFNYLRKELEARVPVKPTYLTTRWYGGLFLFGVLFILLVTGGIAASRLFPNEIPTDVRVWVATILSAVDYAALLYFTSTICIHFVHVGHHVAWSGRFVGLTALLAAVLFVFGLRGGPLIFPFGPLFMVWGILIFGNLFRALWLGKSKREQWFVTGVTLILLASSGYFVARDLGVELALIQGFTYSSRIQAVNQLNQKPLTPNPTFDDLNAYFDSLERRAEWMVLLDRTFRTGYFYWGIASFHKGDYATSRTAFSQAILANPSPDPDATYCLALTNVKLGKVDDAARNLQGYEKILKQGEFTEDPDGPQCCRMLPEAHNTCVQDGVLKN